MYMLYFSSKLSDNCSKYSVEVSTLISRLKKEIQRQAKSLMMLPIANRLGKNVRLSIKIIRF